MASRRRTFGSVRRLPSGRWQTSYWHLGKRHRGPYTFRAKADAQAWLSNVETDIRRGAWVDPSAGQLTVEVLADRWLEHNPAKRKSTLQRDEAIVRLHIVPHLGEARIAAVTVPDVQRLVNSWVQHRAPRTVRRHFDVLRAMFAYAVASDWLARSPCRGIKLPGVPSRPARRLSPDDVATIADSTGERYAPMVWLGAVLGLRWGEVAGMTIGSLNLLERTLTVANQLGRDGELGEPKSRAGRRTQSLPGALAEMLAAHLSSTGLTGADRERLVFTSPEGGPLDYSHWRRRVWLPALEKAGLDGVSFHDLRRLNATQLVREGVDVKTAQTRLGHSDPRLTLAVYAQVVSEADRPLPTGWGNGSSALRARSAHAADSPALRRSQKPPLTWVEVTGLEPAASALRTLRSTN